MSHSDIPTDLLFDAREVIMWIDNESGRADACQWRLEIKDGDGQPVDPETYDFVVRFTHDALTRIRPLIKWMDYRAAAWATDDTVGPHALLGPNNVNVDRLRPWD